jgi:hypothetical protein
MSRFPGDDTQHPPAPLTQHPPLKCVLAKGGEKSYFTFAGQLHCK